MSTPIDIATRPTSPDCYPDWQIDEQGNLQLEYGLVTSVLHSLLCDARDDRPRQDLARDPRGWALENPSDRYGSLIWLHERDKATAEVRTLVEQYATRALQWMVREDVCEAVSVSGEWLRGDILALTINLTRGSASRWQTAWDSPNDSGTRPIPGLVIFLVTS